MNEQASIFNTLYQRKSLVLCVMIVCGSLGAAYTLFAPAVWEAKATVIFPVRQASVLGVSGGDAGALASALGGPTPVKVYAGILESNRTQQFVASQAGIKRKEVERMTKVLDQAMENTISVTARSNDPDLAKKVVALNLQALDAINQELNMPLATNDVDVIKSNIELERKTILDLEEQLLEFQSRAVTAPAVTQSGNGESATLLASPSNWMAALRDVEIKLARVDSEIDQAQKWNDKVSKAGKELPTPFPGTEKWRETLANLEYELRVKRLTFSASAPEVRKLEEQIEIAKKELESELDNYTSATRQGLIDPAYAGFQKLPSLMAEKVALEAQMRAVNKLTELAPSESVELSRLLRGIATHTVILQQLEGQLQLAKLQQGRDPNRWEVLDEPQVGEDPVNKSWFRNGAASLALGAFLSLVMTFLLGPVRPRRVELYCEDERLAA